MALDTAIRPTLSRLSKPADDSAFADREAREKERDAKQRLAHLAGRLGKRYTPALASLDSFKLYHVKQRDAIATLRGFVADIAGAVKEARGLVLFGTVGTGKDHLLAAMLYAAANAGYGCHWMNGQEIFSKFRDGMDTGERESSLMASFVTPQVLGISDPIPPVFDPSKPNAWRAELLYRVLDARYRDCKPTWVSLNAKSPEDADSKLSEPVFDRLQHNAEFVPCFWPSFRERKGV